MFAVGWMELKDAGRARDLLDRSFANITEPFKARPLAAARAQVVGGGAQLLGSQRW